MTNEPIPPDPELNPIEAALRSLVPARGRIDRDRVLFRAGQAAVRSPSFGRRGWMAIAASLALIALAEAAALAHRPPFRIVERVVVVPAPAAPPPERAAVPAQEAPEARPLGDSFGPGPTASDRLAWQVLRYGLDGLPAPPAAAGATGEPWPASSRRRLQEELRIVLNPGDPS